MYYSTGLMIYPEGDGLDVVCWGTDGRMGVYRASSEYKNCLADIYDLM